MCFVAVDDDGSEYVFSNIPKRRSLYKDWIDWAGYCIELPSGSIRKLIGRDLTWEDEPCELKEE